MEYVLIIGAGSDLSFPLARLYANKGFGLFLASRNYDRLKKDAELLHSEFGVDVHAFKFDVTETSSHQQFYDTLPCKPIGVISLAGILGEQLKSEIEFESAKYVIEANFTGLVSILHIIATDFEERESGFIVGVSSVAGEIGRKSNYIYASAKAGFSTFLCGLRNRLYLSKVQVLTVHPGFIRTKMIAGRKTYQFITASPEAVANDIFKAQQSGKDFIYSKWYWRFIMLAFRMMPHTIVKRINLK